MEIQRRVQLVELLKHFGLPMIAIEIGVAGGAFSHELLSNGINKLYSIDVWEHQPTTTGDGNYPQDFHNSNYILAKKMLSQFGDKSVMIKGNSNELSHLFENESIGLIYMDGCHYYECLKKDIEEWLPKLVNGGIMAWHDYDNEGYQVKQVVHEYFKEVHYIPETSVGDSGAWVQKSNI